MKNPKQRITIETADAGLVSPGKSTRLQAMREKALSEHVSPVTVPAPNKVDFRDRAGNLSPELLLARQIIDRRLEEILAGLPVGKQKRLFKIRFGVELEQIRELPIKRICNLLNISPEQFNFLSANMKRIVELNYNGASAKRPAL